MRHSALNPDHKTCRKCHFMDSELQGSHIENIQNDFSPEQDCLECHEGHNECGRCH
jgi:nitrate/TMAO reductase-like tetraheme cytochrome c subunit